MATPTLQEASNATTLFSITQKTPNKNTMDHNFVAIWDSEGVNGP